MTTITKLICPECRHENEAERVYCHNCGARLSKPAAAAAKTEQAETIETRERLRRMMDNRGVKARQLALNITKLLLASCIAAALIQIFLPPDLPAPTSKNSILGPQIGLEVEDALLQHRGAQLTYREEQINTYIGNVLKRKKASLLDKPMLDFQRGVAQFGEGTFRMTLERSFFGLSIYTSGFYSANAQSGKIAATNEGGAIGRMPIHPQLMQYAGFLISDAWKAMEQDRKQVEKFAAIEFHPQTVVLTAPAQ
jgi:ribosomal protein S27E